MAARDVTPTRSVLLDLKRRIKLSQSGHKILKMKRDGLILEFFEIMEKARQMRVGVASDFQLAMKKITIAKVVDGELAVKSAAYALKSHPEVDLSSKSIMGLMVPRVEANNIHTWTDSVLPFRKTDGITVKAFRKACAGLSFPDV